MENLERDLRIYKNAFHRHPVIKRFNEEFNETDINKFIEYIFFYDHLQQHERGRDLQGRPRLRNKRRKNDKC